MKLKKIFLLNTLLSIPLFSVISCQLQEDFNLEHYDANENLSENIYKLDNNLWNSTDIRNGEIAFLIENSDMFKNTIISKMNFQEQKDKINENWEAFSSQFNKIFEKDFLNKYHVIYYSNYSSREPIDSVEVNNNSVKIHHIFYRDAEKWVISGQYLIFIEKEHIPNIKSISINEIKEKADFKKYNNSLYKVKNKIWFSK